MNKRSPANFDSFQCQIFWTSCDIKCAVESQLLVVQSKPLCSIIISCAWLSPMHLNSQQKIYREWSMEQEENKHKTSSTGKLKDGRDTNTTINWSIITHIIYVPSIKYLALNLPWKSHDNNKISCLHQSMWSNRTLSFCIIFFYHFSFNSILFSPLLYKAHICL